MKLIVFDVGGTFIKYAQCDEDGNLSKKGKVETPSTKQGFHEVVQQIIKDHTDIDGLAFSLPGFVDPKRGYISVGGSLRYHDDCMFVKEMQELVSLPVTIQNDAKCAALAQCWKKDASFDTAVVLVFGTGVGGALLQQGELYAGAHFMALELSCILQGNLQTQGLKATLGHRFSIPELMKRIAKRLGVAHLEGETAFALLNEGNKEVMEELQAYSSMLAIQLFNFQCAFDPDVFLIGGGISTQPAFISSIQKSVDQLLAQIPFALPNIRVEAARYQEDANLIGAFVQYIRSESDR